MTRSSQHKRPNPAARTGGGGGGAQGHGRSEGCGGVTASVAVRLRCRHLTGPACGSPPPEKMPAEQSLPLPASYCLHFDNPSSPGRLLALTGACRAARSRVRAERAGCRCWRGPGWWRCHGTCRAPGPGLAPAPGGATGAALSQVSRAFPATGTVTFHQGQARLAACPSLAGKIRAANGKAGGRFTSWNGSSPVPGKGVRGVPTRCREPQGRRRGPGRVQAPESTACCSSKSRNGQRQREVRSLA